MKAKFYWAVVGDGNPEPVAVAGKKGAREAFTIGCADPYFIDQAECPCRLLPTDWGADDEDDPLDVPENTLSEKERKRIERAYQKSRMATHHGYAGFGR